MKVLVDTNVLLSYLLTPTGTSAVVEVVERLLTGQDDLVLPEEVLRELVGTTLNKPYFAERVQAKSVRALVEILTALSTPSPSPESLDRNWVRDPKDDFLIMAALLAEADYLISGDKDLIALGDSLAPLKIRSPQAFIDEIGRA